MNYTTFCGGLGGFPDGTIYQCYDSGAGGVTQQLPGPGSYSVFSDKNPSQFAVALWSRDTVATVKTEKGYTITQSWGKLNDEPAAPYVNVKDQTGYVLYDAVSYPEYGPMQLPWNPHARNPVATVPFGGHEMRGIRSFNAGCDFR
ncbi:hypothetical protein PHSY_005804 [Pseudozyma hubeiensis SY62]|uniref:Uncharacterized protein n=1 Tax=Pseudozyma hubeiensis (strain SY62) TaxID=1305764 RepID=R9PJB7_PSEHS|nr:hypothetical protein PHSY_005804 [Pseudozyma hubeiensis SY62]GAC98215.1 hypothetical protein PHSY_005804 [Pseudozyma hubeiensis SY62]